MQLFWAFHSRTSPHEIEALVTESLVTPNISVDPNAVEAFGVLWRFSGMYREELNDCVDSNVPCR